MMARGSGGTKRPLKRALHNPVDSGNNGTNTTPRCLNGAGRQISIGIELAAATANIWLKANNLFNQGSRMHPGNIIKLAQWGFDTE
jgi:hypothetical protein